jgi:hypothetical protein
LADYDCRVTEHGQHQLELDIKYPVARDRKMCKYELDLYIFTPAGLGLTRERYGVAQFLENLKSHTRHTPPRIPFASLVDPACEQSPLTRIRRRLASSGMSLDLGEERIYYEIRTLVNIHHAETRAVRAMLKAELASPAGAKSATTRLKTFLNELDAFLASARDLHQRLLDSRIPDSLREAMRWADEAISLKTEKEIFRLHDLFASTPRGEEATSILAARLSAEDEYRTSAGYTTHAAPGADIANESFVYRESMLKKWAQAAMYMGVEKSKTVGRIAQAVAGIAAAAAMAFAVTAMFLTERLFASYSVPWAILIVIAYIFKDRIKETLRGFLMAALPRFVTDRTEKLVDPSADRTVGSTRERISFCRPQDVPKSVLFVRDIQSNSFRTILPPENVIHFQKVVRINSRSLMKYHTRLESITEILRLKLDSWLSEMDAPLENLSCVVDGKPKRVPTKRVYHVSLVLSLSSGGAANPPVRFKRRLILNRDGIVRTEKVEETNGRLSGLDVK